MLRVLSDGHLCLALASQKKGAHGVLSFLSKNYWSVWRSLGKGGFLREDVFDAYVIRDVGERHCKVVSFRLPSISHHRNLYHRKGDMPAKVWEDGSKQWWKEGMLYREGDKPAIVWANGSKVWFKEGKRHRDGDKPASVWANGDEEWWKEGKLHRDGDLPAIVYSYGAKAYWKEGKLLRIK